MRTMGLARLDDGLDVTVVINWRVGAVKVQICSSVPPGGLRSDNFPSDRRTWAFTFWQHSAATHLVVMASSGKSAQDCDRYADRRVYPRVPVALAAFLQANGERHAVQLLDLSPAGAKLDCPVSLRAGTAVILDCGTLCRSGVIRWNSGGLVGLCFESELDVREASALIERSRALEAWIKTRE